MLPFRAKNPPEHFPYVTLFLIALNILIFALTSQNFLSVRDQAVEDYAVSSQTFSLMRMVTAMFLHGDLFHLAGNMLFLWIFGASVEGRIRPWFFLPVYFLAGFAGDLLHELFMGVTNPGQYSLGASGAIMGLAGAYVYMFPYSLICVVHREFWLMGWFKVSDCQARAIYGEMLRLFPHGQMSLEARRALQQ